jgi:hypothetical protein
MQTLTRPAKLSGPLSHPRRPRRRFSPLMFIGAAVTLLIILGAGVFLVVRPHLGTHADNVNMDCSLIVPPNPLTAQGLATPYQLIATDANNGPCNESNPNQAAFVQGAVLDPTTGQISVYDPLVIDAGTQPAAAPVVPTLPKNAIVALWFGFNGNNLTLVGNKNTLNQAHCVNGADGSIFNQVAYCNAVAFFQAANQAIQQGLLKVPALGTARDGLPCPTTRDFSVVDMDPSDNVTTTYLVLPNGQTAQVTAANQQALPNAVQQDNGSDNGLLTRGIDPALGCSPWMAPDLANPGNLTTALPLNEIQASLYQKAPVALVPAGDDMVVVNNNQPDLDKLNAYRRGVDQPQVYSLYQASTKQFCANLRAIAPQRLLLDSQFTQNVPSPAANMANNLFTFLAQRFVTTYGPNGLNCVGLLHMPDPVSVKFDGNGVAISATINVNGTGGTNSSAPNCKVNGTTINGCSGTTTINGQSCTFSFADNTVNLVCGQGGNGQYDKDHDNK